MLHDKAVSPERLCVQSEKKTMAMRWDTLDVSALLQLLGISDAAKNIGRKNYTIQ
jgi:hypothetical protein